MTGMNTLALGFDGSNNVTKPAAIGEVLEYLLKQYFIDHYYSHLYATIITSASQSIADREWACESESQNQITILEKSQNKLVLVGTVPNVATSKYIYSV